MSKNLGTAFGRFSITLWRFLRWNLIIAGRKMIHKQGGCLGLHEDVCFRVGWLGYDLRERRL